MLRRYRPATTGKVAPWSPRSKRELMSLFTPGFGCRPHLCSRLAVAVLRVDEELAHAYGEGIGAT